MLSLYFAEFANRVFNDSFFRLRPIKKAAALHAIDAL